MKKKGFTIIELLFVVAFIGIISAITIPALLGQKDRAAAVQHAQREGERYVGMSATEALGNLGAPNETQNVEGVTFCTYWRKGFTLIIVNGTVTSVQRDQ
jgi:prepilin-type N-terminal cleavage/methylation domain-containing protein